MTDHIFACVWPLCIKWIFQLSPWCAKPGETIKAHVIFGQNLWINSANGAPRSFPCKLYPQCVCIWPTGFVHSLTLFSSCQRSYLRNWTSRFMSVTEAPKHTIYKIMSGRRIPERRFGMESFKVPLKLDIKQRLSVLNRIFKLYKR